MSGYEYLAAGYLAIWIVLFGYFVALWRRQSRVRDGLDKLEERLGEPRQG